MDFPFIPIEYAAKKSMRSKSASPVLQKEDTASKRSKTSGLAQSDSSCVMCDFISTLFLYNLYIYSYLWNFI